MDTIGDVSARADITSRDDIIALLRAFYGRAYSDELIGFIFTEVTRMDLDLHLPVMADFWETVLFRAGLYKRNALQAHVNIHMMSPLSGEQFGRWLDLWCDTVDSLFVGDSAELAKQQASRVAWSMTRRLNGESGSEFVTLRHRSQVEGGPAES